MFGSRRFPAILLALGIGLSLALPAEAQRPDRVKIGGTVAVTGRLSSDWGPGIIEFMKGWERLVNAEGGVFVREYNAKLPIELVLYDDESSPEKSVELYEKLAAVDKVQFFIGPGSSPITLRDRKSTRLNSSHDQISYAVFCLKKKKTTTHLYTTVVAVRHVIRAKRYHI